MEVASRGSKDSIRGESHSREATLHRAGAKAADSTSSILAHFFPETRQMELYQEQYPDEAIRYLDQNKKGTSKVVAGSKTARRRTSKSVSEDEGSDKEEESDRDDSASAFAAAR